MYCFFFRSTFLSAVSLLSDRSFHYLPLCSILWIFNINFSNFVCILRYVCYSFSLICFSYLSLGAQISKEALYFCTLFYRLSIFFINLYSFHSICSYFTFFTFLQYTAAPQQPPFHFTFTKSQFFSFFLSNTLLFKYEYAFFNVFLTFHWLLVFNIHQYIHYLDILHKN